MTYKQPTYKEYCKASEFARLRYKIGCYVQIVCVILLLLLLFYTVSNIEEMKAHPLVYAEEKLGIDCFIFTPEIYDGTIRDITNIKE